MGDLIQPRTLRGFRDVLPARAALRAGLIARLQAVFAAHGYAPIETPALEYAEILKGKGGEDFDKELFEFADKSGRQVALRNDLTVPLARFVAQHQGQLVFPFRRSHIGSCWRGERPQRGRAREFVQCDADLIGAVGVAADAEVLVLLASAYEALDVGHVTLRINDRRLLNAMLERFEATDLATPVLRALDKREKQGDEAVRRELAGAGLPEEAGEALLAACRPGEDDAATLAALAEAVAGSAAGERALAEFEQMRALVFAAGRPEADLRVDPSIARGLDYYTGMVVEAQFDALPEIGSVGSGGRYDDLAALYTKTRLPGVGVSIGIVRLLDALEALDRLPAGSAAPTAMVAHTGAAGLTAAFALAAALRAEGIATEVFPEARKHGQQMRYADRRGIAYVLTPEAEGGFHGKRMADGETASLADAAAVRAWIR